MNTSNAVKATRCGGFQGDIGLRRIEALPAGVEPVINEKRLTIAYGEATGHEHKFVDQGVNIFFAKENNKLFVILTQPSALYHDEHSPVMFDTGTYEVLQQEEYTYEGEFRKVVD